MIENKAIMKEQRRRRSFIYFLDESREILRRKESVREEKRNTL
jgi:hypothetical protein